MLIAVVVVAAALGLFLFVAGIGSQSILADAEQAEKAREFTR